jgi:indolepyruvate ferredoxin oxidoreductase alpha subunit
MKQTLMGNDAIALALVHSDVNMISGYPGTPSSEILGNVQKLKFQQKLDIYAEWATNEKVGFEVAYAGAITGKRTCATMKQVGLNVASDALMSAAHIGNKGGFVFIVADDPGFHSSQTEQDSRVFAKFARVPVLDPSSVQEAYDFTKLAFEVSQKFETPVMLRPVMRVCHGREIVEVDATHTFKNQEGNFVRNIQRWAAVPRAGRLAQGYEQLDRIEKIAQFNWDQFIAPQTANFKGGKLLLLCSGMGYSYGMEALEDLDIQADVLKFDMPYPLPKNKIESLFDNYEKVLVLEESYPCIEEQLSSPKLFGKLTKTTHEIDEFNKDKVLQSLANIGMYEGDNRYKANGFRDEVPARPPNLCPGCPHRDIYFAIMKVFRKKKSIYPSDIGCYTLGLNQGAIDTVLCMGASVSMASGFSIADKEKYVVATLGDSTFIHGGIPALINAKYQKHKFLLVILDNSVVAMTGRQTTPERANEEVDIKKIVEGCSVECFEHTYSPDVEKSIEFFKGLKKRYDEADGPIVALIREFCVLDKERAPDMLPNIFATVDEEKCVACDLCTVDYKCPPMSYNENGKITIDPFLCIGCSACLDNVCPTDAFIEFKGANQ